MAHTLLAEHVFIHPILIQQLRGLHHDDFATTPSAATWHDFLAAVSESYREAQLKIEHLERGLANLSHDIRTPILGLRAMTTTRLETELEAEQHNFVKNVRDSSDALLTLLEDSLETARSDPSQAHFAEQEFDLPHAVDSVAAVLASRAQSKGLELICNIDNAVPESLLGDPRSFRQILIHLLNNAITFTSQGEVAIHVSLVDEQDDLARIRVSVTDTGIGIPKESLPTLFEVSPQGGGTSAGELVAPGLALSRRLAEGMSGEVKVQSAVGRGSMFWFTVRLREPGASRGLRERHAPELKDVRVLIVDDNGSFREVLQAQLRDAGMVCSSAHDGLSALELIRRAAATEEPFDVAIIDYAMPGMDGLELTRALRAEVGHEQLPVLLLTTWTERPSGKAIAAAGIPALITKPTRSQQVVEELARLLSQNPGSRHGDRSDDTTKERQSAPRATILLVEDNRINQRVATHMLQRCGHTVELACNGAEALEALQRRSFDLVLMDCQMPVMSGFEATREIRKSEGDARHTTVIALTASATTEDQQACLDAGMDDCLAKPIHPEALEALLEQHIRRDPVVSR